MFTRIISVAAAMLCAIAVNAATAFEYNGYKYEVTSEEDATVKIAAYQPKYQGYYTLPGKVIYNDKEYTVTEVAAYAFNANPYMTGITLPASVKTIGNYALANNTKATEIVAPGVVSVGTNAFYFAGFTSISLPETTTIGNNAFSNMSALTKVDLPKVTSLGTMVFYNSRNLADVTLGDNLTTLPDNTFGNCAITSFTFPANVTTCGRAPFGGCSKLKEVIVNDKLQTLGDRTFAGTAIENLTLPESLTAIGTESFDGCSSLASITLPSSFTTIPAGTFKNCPAIVTMTNLPKGITTIGDNAFSGCSGLETITLPDALTEIGVNAFAGCSSLKVFEIGSKLTTLNPSALKGLGALSAINVADGNATFASEDGVLFNNDKSRLIIYPCANPGNDLSYSVPSTVKTVDAEAFYRSNAVKSVTFTEGVEEIGYKAFNESSVESVVLPNSLTSWADNVFDSATSLTSITLPTGLTKVPKMSFYKCSSLLSVSIPEGYETIAEEAFNMCTSLNTVNLPSTTELIEKGAFNGCNSISEIHVAATLDPVCAPYSLDGVSRTDCTIYVPAGCVKTYRDAETWGEFTNIVEDSGMSGIDGTFAAADDNVSIIVNNGILSIEAGSAIPTEVYTTGGACIYSSDTNSATLTLPAGVYIVRYGNETRKVAIF